MTIYNFIDDLLVAFLAGTLFYAILYWFSFSSTTKEDIKDLKESFNNQEKILKNYKSTKIESIIQSNFKKDLRALYIAYLKDIDDVDTKLLKSFFQKDYMQKLFVPIGLTNYQFIDNISIEQIHEIIGCDDKAFIKWLFS